ncbi:MAG: M20/M25/M40 family metallo-hydrolase [Synergistaceae bacterium]|nr:M20/M25/M40 family metallo-hydrolase [Synergistaceae bacterium]
MGSEERYLPDNRLFARYDRLIRTPSVTGSEEAVAGYVAGELESMGLPVEWHWAEEKKWPSLKTTLKGSDPSAKSLLLIGHLDTVAVTEGWRTDPFTPVVDGDRVYALGSSDMKGGIAAILEAVNRFIEKSGGRPQNRGDLHLAFSADEEGLSRGTYKLLKEGLSADMAIMAECRFSNIAIGFRGRYSMTADVRGAAAHASRYPEMGRNAIIDAAKLAVAIEELPTAKHPEAGSGTWCIRHIEGGIKTTLSVPDKCGIFIDRYVVPGETPESCTAQVLGAAKSLGIEDRVTVALTKRDTPFMESFVIERDHPLLLSVTRNFREVTGSDPSLEIDRSVCDSNYLVVLGGIPTVTFGPSGEGFHGPNEFGSIKEVEQAAEIYERVIRDIIC